MSKPNFMSIWNAFPDHLKYPTMKDLFTHLGGQAERNINVPGFGPNGNTCASRLSIAFNKSGWPINTAIAASVGARTLRAEDGSRIIYGVKDLELYLAKILGKPNTPDTTIPFDSDIKGKRGIIVFRVNWNDATGHIALFNGHTYREPRYDDYSRYINQNNPSIRTQQSIFWEFN
ncbi:MAG: T6SS effector amidase Tae4 family protein [Alcaligenaceae bacterium]|nr:T6SS effector amidase Tae4 family protein [Alcaligenaceae bacterium]